MAPDNSLRSENRKALLGVYAALDRTGKLAQALAAPRRGVRRPLESYSQLQKAAANSHQQELPIHRIHLAGAAMKMLRDRIFFHRQEMLTSSSRGGVDNSINAAFAVSDNISLVSTARSGAAPPPRTISVPVHIPANTAVTLVASEMTSQSGHRIPSSCIQVKPCKFQEPEEKDVGVVVTVSAPHAPNDVYQGWLRCVDPPIEVAFVVAIYELGEPLL